ncbi:conserved hypothetical protein [Catalinimonas alkaloidigena]|uniref:Glycosyl transferase n=1 Tax=Catalinimonas alkaloidigena TaxID=1075417 RepID=A0A1G9EDJ1_9BACT|nr:glycosyltransferase family protein [Catalinimonas alkaloidigena]SDK74219.1 conserved hypothetical protein [Catalinimonas alkaloidigena]
MKVLYAIQGTGNGHLSRARDIIPVLQQRADVDILVSGTQADVKLPYPIRYQCGGMGFVFGKSGGVDLWQTYRQANTGRFYREVRDLPVHNYDLVINDFEPVSAWACRWQRTPCVALSHQYAVLAPTAPKPIERDRFGEFILKQYAPATAHYGFHFASFAENIYTPVIRAQVRRLTPTDLGHYTVYLPSYDDEKLVKKLSRFPDVRWEVFSKHNRHPFTRQNVTIRPVDNEAFLHSMATSSGVLCGAGFETPAEALFLGKKLLVIPMKTQYEQQCNAAALSAMGVPVIKSLKKKHFPILETWLQHGQPIPVHFPDLTQCILERILDTHTAPQASSLLAASF